MSITHETRHATRQSDVHGGLLRRGRGGSIRPEAAGSLVPGLDAVVVEPSRGHAEVDLFKPRAEFSVWLAEIVALSAHVTDLDRNPKVGAALRTEIREASRRLDLAIAANWFVSNAQSYNDSTAVFFGRNVQFVLLGGSFERRDLTAWISDELSLEIPC
jgi:hypothetical protein